jgi:hypothetical protein
MRIRFLKSADAKCRHLPQKEAAGPLVRTRRFGASLRD